MSRVKDDLTAKCIKAIRGNLEGRLRFHEQLAHRDEREIGFLSKLLAVGREFYDVDVKQSILLRKTDRLKSKQCFLNCQVTATDRGRKGLQYWEGFGAKADPIPIAHAWLVKRGKVIDPTWIDPKMAKTENPPRVAYLGLRIPRKFIIKKNVKTGYAEQLLPEYVEFCAKHSSRKRKNT